jgi:hypothetical protein
VTDNQKTAPTPMHFILQIAPTQSKKGKFPKKVKIIR